MILRLPLVCVVCLSLLTCGCLAAQNTPDENFPLPKESTERAAGVQEGQTLTFEWNASKIFPGTQRTIRVYVPAAYDGKKPACVAVFQDRGGYRFETVFDNLIHSGEMPVTIAVVVPSGNVRGAIDPKGARHNRTFEYDSPGDRTRAFFWRKFCPRWKPCAPSTAARSGFPKAATTA